MMTRTRITDTRHPFFSRTWELYESAFPADEMKRRRVGFYQRLGFALNAHHYMQPPYTEGGSPVPLLLMTHPITVTEAAVRDFCRTYHPVLTDYT